MLCLEYYIIILAIKPYLYTKTPEQAIATEALQRERGGELIDNHPFVRRDL